LVAIRLGADSFALYRITFGIDLNLLDARRPAEITRHKVSGTTTIGFISVKGSFVTPKHVF
jgi:hypothetical protein